MLNQISIMGRLVKDPELRRANETPVCMIRIACDRDYKNASGEKEADFGRGQSGETARVGAKEAETTSEITKERHHERACERTGL